MDLNRNDSPNNNNNNNDGRKPGGNRPKGSIGTALLITLAIVLLDLRQYLQEPIYTDFLFGLSRGEGRGAAV